MTGCTSCTSCTSSPQNNPQDFSWANALFSEIGQASAKEKVSQTTEAAFNALCAPDAADIIFYPAIVTMRLSTFETISLGVNSHDGSVLLKEMEGKITVTTMLSNHLAEKEKESGNEPPFKQTLERVATIVRSHLATENAPKNLMDLIDAFSTTDTPDTMPQKDTPTEKEREAQNTAPLNSDALLEDLDLFYKMTLAIRQDLLEQTSSFSIIVEGSSPLIPTVKKRQVILLPQALLCCKQNAVSEGIMSPLKENAQKIVEECTQMIQKHGEEVKSQKAVPMPEVLKDILQDLKRRSVQFNT